MLTGTITLRDVDARDLPIFFAHQRDPEATRMAAFPPRDHDAFMAHWTKLLGDPALLTKTILVGTEVAGNLGSWTQSGERLIGYWLGREYWGQGIASAALRQFLALIATRPLTAHVAKHNLASLRVLQKCGFTIAGEDTYALPPNDAPCEEYILTLGAT